MEIRDRDREPGMKRQDLERIKITSILDGEVMGAYRSTTLPFLSTKNLVKFHLMLLPRSPPLCDFRYLYSGA
jgi:hypothetical protein